MEVPPADGGSQHSLTYVPTYVLTYLRTHLRTGSLRRVPRAEHACGHKSALASEQAWPWKPASHTHSPSRQTPWAEQPSIHSSLHGARITYVLICLDTCHILVGRATFDTRPPAWGTYHLCFAMFGHVSHPGGPSNLRCTAACESIGKIVATITFDL